MNAIIGFLGRQGGFEECLEQEEPVAYQFYHSSKYPDRLLMYNYAYAASPSSYLLSIFINM